MALPLQQRCSRDATLIHQVKGRSLEKGSAGKAPGQGGQAGTSWERWWEVSGDPTEDWGRGEGELEAPATTVGRSFRACTGVRSSFP